MKAKQIKEIRTIFIEEIGGFLDLHDTHPIRQAYLRIIKLDYEARNNRSKTSKKTRV